MEDLITRIEEIAENLETFAWILKDKEDHGHIKGQSINAELEIYSDIEYMIRDIFKELKENHGSKLIS